MKMLMIMMEYKVGHLRLIKKGQEVWNSNEVGKPTVKKYLKRMKKV